jgi:septal ring factor EnvC (AmiA/AmiB activator)
MLMIVVINTAAYRRVHTVSGGPFRTTYAGGLYAQANTKAAELQAALHLQSEDWAAKQAAWQADAAQQEQQWRHQLQELQSQHASAQAELTAALGNASGTEAQLATVLEHLCAAEAQRDSAVAQQQQLQEQLTATKSQLQAAQAQLLQESDAAAR